MGSGSWMGWEIWNIFFVAEAQNRRTGTARFGFVTAVLAFVERDYCGTLFHCFVPGKQEPIAAAAAAEN